MAKTIIWLVHLKRWSWTNSTFLRPQIVDYDSHRPDKVNYSIHRSNTRLTYQRIEELLSYAIHGVAHTTSILETDFLASKWHIIRLPPNSTK